MLAAAIATRTAVPVKLILNPRSKVALASMTAPKTATPREPHLAEGVEHAAGGAADLAGHAVEDQRCDRRDGERAADANQNHHERHGQDRRMKGEEREQQQAAGHPGMASDDRQDPAESLGDLASYFDLKNSEG